MKTYKIIKKRKGTEVTIEGTVERLVEYFSYTLEIGASYNSKINKKPKTISSFMKNLQMSLDEKEGSCFERTYIKLVD